MVSLSMRPFLKRRLIDDADIIHQAKRAFDLDFTLCLVAGTLMSLHNSLVLGIPIMSTISLFLGSVIAGFFAGLDAALRQEREVIMAAMKTGSPVIFQKKYYPLTRKFTLVAVTTFIFVSLVLMLIFTRDVEWLLATRDSQIDMHDAQLAVILEIFFVMLVLTLLVVNLIVSYSGNLKLLFTNLTNVLEKVRDGNLSIKVPVATHDEFGVIASHTNHMIDGLRHRFQLLSSLELAKEVQQNLLPHASPLLPNFDISGASIYCEQTGGDYYDYLLLPDEKMAVVVADACGHGVGAALLISSVRAFLNAAITKYSGPADLLEEINRYVTRDCAKTSRFTSMFFVEIEPQTRVLRWLRAGHEPPVYYDFTKRKISQLNGGGLVLGIDSSHSYQDVQEQRMNQGDVLVITTDGIREAVGPDGQLYGEERLETVLRANVHLKALEIRDRIIDDVETFRGETPLEDDVTLVVIKSLFPIAKNPTDEVNP
jgi:sigma-B regulation protein RsbU (phosphoserine phosphatase)